MPLKPFKFLDILWRQELDNCFDHSEIDFNSPNGILGIYLKWLWMRIFNGSILTWCLCNWLNKIKGHSSDWSFGSTWQPSSVTFHHVSEHSLKITIIAPWYVALASLGQRHELITKDTLKRLGHGHFCIVGVHLELVGAWNPSIKDNAL